MFEKVNPAHPDKIADRIAGAIVDLAYKQSAKSRPKIAVEVLIGHGVCHVICETSVHLIENDVLDIVKRIAGDTTLLDYFQLPQDPILAKNQENRFACGDNGIFKGVPMTYEEYELTKIAGKIFDRYRTDGKYIINGNLEEEHETLIVCQSQADEMQLLNAYPNAAINPLGHWTGGLDVDTGATNRKLGSDMGGSVTGGGLHGKDLSKADVSVNIYAWLKAQAIGRPVELFCAIGDEKIDDRPYQKIMQIAENYIRKIGGFEKFAEWGLLRPDGPAMAELLRDLP